MENQKKLWFRTKRYGWGWVPVTWQGWLILLAYILGIIIIAKCAIYITELTGNTGGTFLWNYLPPLFILSGILIFICYKTGEKPRWRWGGK